MAIVARMARFVLELVDMTENDACRQYEKHVAECRKGCKPAQGRLCKAGVKLHGQWKAQEARQPAARR